MGRPIARPDRPLAPAVALFPALAALWIVPRLLPIAEAPSPAVSASVESVRVAASPASGRYEVQGGAAPGAESAALSELPDAAAARARLESSVRAVNDDLALRADRVSGRIELFPEEGITGLRVSGLIVPFYDNDAGRLAALREHGRDRPVEALTNAVEILEARLSEPQPVLGPEDTVRQRDLTRLARDLRDALADAEARNREATERFRTETVAAARRAGGPFHRRGPLRIAEIVLAAMLAATLRAAAGARRTDDAPPLWLTLSAAAAVATAGVLLLEGTDLLPVDPVTGTALRFLPLAAGLGLLTAAGLEREWNGGEPAGTAPARMEVASAESLVVEAERAPAPAGTAPAGTPPDAPARAAPPPAVPVEPSPAPISEREIPDAPPPRPREAPPRIAPFSPEGSPERLPFFRRRGRR